MRDLTLHQTNASGPLVPSRFTQAFALLAKLGTTPRATMHGQELRLTVALSPDDDACAAFLLDFAGQGLRVRGTARGPGADLLSWAFHTLAASLRCTLSDAELGGEVEAAPEEHRPRALSYLTQYEAEVRAHRQKRDVDDDGVAFVDWLAREELVALAADAAAIGAGLPMDDAPALYERLLESEGVDDVFISERELGWLLSRFRARRAAG